MRQHLDPSELGTREYWDQAYARELVNHADDADDEGTIWFDDTGAEDKVIQLLEGLDDQGLIHKEIDAARILDLGTGNGHMLFALKEEGWQGELVGVDYSRTSVDLARQIEARRQETWDLDQQDNDDSTNGNEVAGTSSNITFDVWDLLGEQAGDWLGSGFDVVHDKGTFDAISLSAETDVQGRRICETYRDRVVPLIKPGKFLVITSCNWTKEELLHWFIHDTIDLELFGEAKYPTFTFGGQQGQSVCTLVFQRRSK